jgi:DNA mismatch endonuclease, patch repair protein
MAQVSKETRSYIMSKIKKTDTKPELTVRKYLFSKGFRYRLHVKKLPGNPDIVLPRYRVVIFINGCFWHAHEGCNLNRMPKTRTEYWIPKINGNVVRDKLKQEQLQSLGWRVFVIWECELKKSAEDILSTLVHKLKEIKIN